MKIYSSSIALGLAAAVLFSPAVVMAEEGTIEEIVVTAQKREQAVTDVAATVAAFTGENLRANGIDTPKDIAFLVPNVDIKGTQGDANPAVTIRGVGMNNFNSNNNPAVGVYVDEVFLSSPSLVGIAMFDVERIEVLKGPQGTLYGRNASGGALNIHNAKPTQETSGFISAQAGNYETLRLEGGAGGGLGDSMAGRVSFLYDDQGESYHDYFDEDDGSKRNFNDSKTWGLRGQLGNDGEAFSWNLGVSHLNQDLGNQPFTFVGGVYDIASGPYTFVPCAEPLNPSICGDVAGFSDTTDSDDFTHVFENDKVGDLKIDSEISGLNFNFDLDIGEATLTSITGYLTQDRVYGENFWSTPNELFAVVHDEEIEQISQEFRLTGGNDTLAWMGGLFFTHDEFDGVNDVQSLDLGALLLESNPLIWTIDQETDAWAAFGNIDWYMSDQFTLTLGLRYTDEKTKFAGGTSGIALFDDALGIPGIVAGDEIEFTFLDDKFEDDKLTYRVALEYRPTDDNLLYGSWSTGFKSGGFYGDFTLDNGELEPFDSETVDALELGWKSTFAQGRAQFNLAGFWYDYQDIQTFVPASFGFKLDNIEGADIYGLDAEIIARPIAGLDLRAGLGLLDTKTSSAIPELDGNELPNAGELQWTLGARYEFPVSDNFMLAIQGDAKYTDKMFREATNNPLTRTDDYTLLNARLSFLPNDGRWDVSAYVYNATDEEYFQEAFFADLIGAVAGLAGAPRTYGLSFTYNLGQ